MRIALISDIHGNLEALQTALEEIEKLNVDKIHGLGDFVGYMTNPNECVELTKDFESVMGNHESALFDRDELSLFNEYAKKALLWTKNELTPANVKLLSALPYKQVYVDLDYTIAHGSLISPFEYINNFFAAWMNFDLLETQVLFVGHTHVPVFWRGYKTITTIGHQPEQRSPHPRKVTTFELKDDEKYIVNVGSVGQPRDFVREVTIKKMIDLDFPAELYIRIAIGT